MNDKVNFPANALPLDADMLGRVQQFDSKALYWLSGYCSGLADAKGHATGEVASSDSLQQLVGGSTNSSSIELKTVVLYASQSGNAEKVAQLLYSKLSGAGVDAQLASVADFKTKELKQQQVILMVASTHGEGEPPDDAIDFHEFVLGKRAPKLDGVKYAVLSLGDSSYEFFCQTGKDFDQAFSKLGAEALLERVDCDLDYEEQAESWSNNLVEKISDLKGADGSTSNAKSTAPLVQSQTWSKEKPFAATILANQKITGQGSVKHINHIEISLEGSGIQYLPGDSLGVWAKNDREVVSRILDVAGLSGEEPITFKNESRSIKQA
ncbi:MAG: flavodoxin domain-containing protein, partial [Kangiellaceae bacterium]|nr:flavodoxin domain-containing protein [Kangiellaceae bacterium]